MVELYVDIQKNLGDFCLNVQFSAGEGVTGLLGASGCGKTMTLKCIAGLERPDRGVIRLNGRTLFDSERNIDLPPQKRRVGYLFQNYALFPNMTVGENILCGRPGEGREFAVRMCREFGLAGLENRYPRQLSGGQAQRVALARSLGAEPELLLLDEPFSALDSQLREELRESMLGKLGERGQQTILVTHDREEARGLCRALRLMDGGRVIRSGETRAVFADPGSPAAARLTGCRNLAPARRVGERAVEVPEWGVTLKTARPVPENLTAVGIYPHDLGEAGENPFPIRVAQVMDTLRGRQILFRVGEGGALLSWQHPGEGALPTQVSFPPEHILFFTQGGTR